MKRNKIWTIISWIIFALQFAAEAATAATVIWLNMLPNHFVVILLVGLALLLLLTGGLMFIHGKNPVSNVRRIIAWVLAILIILGCGVVAKLAADAYKTIHAVTEPPVKTDIASMYVLVRLDDPAQTYADTLNYAYGILAEYDEDNVQQAVLMIGQQAGGELKVTAYEKITEIADGLLAGQVDAWIVNGAAIALLTDDEDAGYEDYMAKVRILGEIPLSSLQAEEPTTEPSTAPEEIIPTVTNSPFVVYISGSDTRSKKFKVSRSDVNIVAVVHPVTKQVLLISTPRDAYVPNPAGKGKKDKLTNCGLYGVDCSMEVLSTLFEEEINYSCQINFTGFKALIDAMGGITIHSDQAFATIKNYRIVKGENHLDGAEALAYARERYHVKGGDNGRSKNQMKVVEAMIKKLTEGTTIITNYASIMESLEGLFRTSFTMEEISALVKMQLGDMATWNIQSYAVTGSGNSKVTYSSPGRNVYVYDLDKKSVSYAVTLVDRVIAGDTLTAEDMKVPK